MAFGAQSIPRVLYPFHFMLVLTEFDEDGRRTKMQEKNEKKINNAPEENSLPQIRIKSRSIFKGASSDASNIYTLTTHLNVHSPISLL